jgi:hypothetical protein
MAAIHVINNVRRKSFFKIHPGVFYQFIVEYTGKNINTKEHTT